MKLKELIEKLELLERERVPNDIRILGITTYIQVSSTRKTAKILSESRFVLHSCVEVDKEVLGEITYFD